MNALILVVLLGWPPYHQCALDLFTPEGINVNKFNFVDDVVSTCTIFICGVKWSLWDSVRCVVPAYLSFSSARYLVRLVKLCVNDSLVHAILERMNITVGS
jgi:hypothetical protein